MHLDDPKQKRIFLDALTSYADSCVQPALTPSCPYYRIENGVAVCGEECHALLEAHGVSNRPVQSLAVGGVVMTGRSIPAAVVAGWEGFDATGTFLSDRDLPVREQRTAALFLGLRVELFRNVLSGSRNTALPLEIWGELERRGIDMDRVFAGGIAPSMAKLVMVRTIIELLARDGLIDASDILTDGGAPDGPSWSALVLEAIADSPPDPHVWRDAQLEPLLSVLGTEPSFLGGKFSWESVLQRKDIQYVVSRAFSRRTVEWFVGLATHELEAALRGDVPSIDLFAALPAHEARQIGGLWIWERFTLTDPETWTASSLLQEWQWSRGGSTDICDRRVLSERSMSSEEVAEAAMNAFADEDDGAPTEMFNPRNYVQAASNLLASGEWDKAARIFQGLVDLRPGDGEAWNNLGFCQLGSSAAVALPMLRRGAALMHPLPVISIANQVLALHLLDRDGEAIVLAETSFDDPVDASVSATVWLHPVEEGELELGHVTSPMEYLVDLMAHIAEQSCVSRGNDIPA